MPGSGKTTLGRALAGHGLHFADLDSLVEQRVGCSVADYINARGIEAFRQVETDTLRSLVDIEPSVIATGGGTPCQGANMELMNATGLTVLLTCERQRHIRRIREAGAQRPMFASVCSDDAAVDALLTRLEDERRPYYSRAAVAFDASRLETPAEVTDTAARFMELLGRETSAIR